MENTTNQLLTTGPLEGQILSLVGDTYRLIVTGEQTGGAWAIIDMLVPPGGGHGPHEHADFHETFYVPGGEVQFDFEDKTVTAKKGQTVSSPQGGGVHASRTYPLPACGCSESNCPTVSAKALPAGLLRQVQSQIAARTCSAKAL
jgi:hypothetical protein